MILDLCNFRFVRDFGAFRIFNQKLERGAAYLKRYEIVPLSYHHRKNIEKTKGMKIPLEYLYSTTIFYIDPYAILSKNQANL